MSLLPSISKILEKIICSRLFTYIIENDILYDKQSGHQEGYSRNHEIVQRSDQINQSFYWISLL